MDHLAVETAAAAAAETSFEVGWRLTSDGQRLAKRVAWAQSELGFGAAVEAACADAGPAGTDPANHTLPAMVQLELGAERALRPAAEGDVAASADRLLEHGGGGGSGGGSSLLQQYHSACLQFVFDHEAALDPVSFASGSPPSPPLLRLPLPPADAAAVVLWTTLRIRMRTMENFPGRFARIASACQHNLV